LSIPGPNSDHTLSEPPKTPRGEFAAIERIRRGLDRRQPRPAPGEVWIGDDAAVLSDPNGILLLATDLTVAGVHADLEIMGLDDLGWRAFVAALSDIAAMGGKPGHAVVGVAGPPSTDLDLLYEGIGEAAASHGCPVVGGDLTTADQLVVSVAVTGSVVDGPGPVLRSGAAPGDSLLVTGALGGSAAGLRLLREHRARRQPPSGAEGLFQAHRRPCARLEEGEAARRSGASAMIDVSDGLAADLVHMAKASVVGFELTGIPVAAGATEKDALGGGEDYELVVATSDPSAMVEEFTALGLRVPVVIGCCTDDPRERTLRGEKLEPSGFEHPWS